jgi:thiol-disulfide isomerase/thioredoxin
MKLFLTILLVLSFSAFAAGQNELAPIVEKRFDLKDWVYPNVVTGTDMNLRKFVRGKKLVMVVYWAPWCPNWKHDAPFVQSLYEKYKDSGLDIIGVGEYDTVEKMKSSLEANKITFPSVYESDSKEAREKTPHYTMRRAAGDTRKWGSPWYVFLTGTTPEPTGDVQAASSPVVNGELIREEAEKYIREKLGLPPLGSNASASISKEIEVCEEDKPLELKKP